MESSAIRGWQSHHGAWIALVLTLFSAQALLFSRESTAATIEVTRADDPPADGCRPNDCSLREATIRSNNDRDGDRIILKAGVYRLTQPPPRRRELAVLPAVGDLDVRGRVSIVGRGSQRSRIVGLGTDVVFDLRGPRGIRLDRLVVDAGPTEENAEPFGVRADLSYEAYKAGKRVTISRSAVLGGGGGISAGGNLALRRVSVLGNSGWGVDAFEADIRRSKIIGNGREDRTSSYLEGGLVVCERLGIEDSLIRGNRAEGSGNAGGIRVGDNGEDCPGGRSKASGIRVVGNRSRRYIGGYDGGRADVRDSVFVRNRGGFVGGAAGFGQFAGSIVRDNRADSTGGLVFSGRIVRSMIANNVGGVGGIESSGGSIERSTIAGNTGTADNDFFAGGGVNLTGGVVSITNSTIAENSTAGSGGGIYAYRPFRLTNVTLARNEAAVEGGGLATLRRRHPSAEVKNTLFARNDAPVAPDCAAHITSNGANVFGGEIAGCRGASRRDVRTDDPRVGLLADNGGPTATVALRKGSEAIGRAAAAAAPRFDQRGVVRDRHPDVGAFERR